MTSLFISDLHLSPNQPELTQLVCDFLQNQQCDRLYILGDIFNTWLGDDLVLPEYTPFVQTLQQLQKNGTQIFLMVGNRDFMLGKSFATSVGATLLDDPTVHILGNQRVLLMHGDSLCIDDESYQRYRKIVRNRFLQWCFLRLPLRVRQSISDKIKAKSQQQKRHKTYEIMDVNSDEVLKVMNDFRCPVLIHGHTHRPDIHALPNNAFRIVLGDWHDTPSFLLITDNVYQLVDIRLTNSEKTLTL